MQVQCIFLRSEERRRLYDFEQTFYVEAIAQSLFSTIIIPFEIWPKRLTVAQQLTKLRLWIQKKTFFLCIQIVHVAERLPDKAECGGGDVLCCVQDKEPASPDDGHQTCHLH